VRDEELPRLTDRRFRVESARNRSTAGAGLGLAVAKLIVDAHEGSMEAKHSDLGGLRWHVVLPRAADPGQV
jgi:two-component system sensor histidine kinase BaeS